MSDSTAIAKYREEFRIGLPNCWALATRLRDMVEKFNDSVARALVTSPKSPDRDALNDHAIFTQAIGELKNIVAGQVHFRILEEGQE